MSAAIGVSTSPGAIALRRIPSAAQASSFRRTHRRSAAFGRGIDLDRRERARRRWRGGLVAPEDRLGDGDRPAGFALDRVGGGTSHDDASRRRPRPGAGRRPAATSTVPK